MGKSQKRTVTQGLDPASQQFVNQMRQFALGGANQIAGMGPLTVGPDQRPIMEQINSFHNFVTIIIVLIARTWWHVEHPGRTSEETQHASDH
jgi:hypothetical protein